ncbi:hypothetical protein EDD37DRAFT_665060 [Exophiala viscosa]|uniref:uncharacterized protein n=1 Tax=Exophiala viscosa TaxID=2486360 RepID=UPI00219A4539|nr:hypothetical protein EDD37DRAFT_665060 [Exophiala viscosa]
MSTMKAVLLDRSHQPPALRLTEEYPRPHLVPGKLLVKVKAFAVNHADVMTRKGSGAKGPAPTADIIGIELIGLVVGVSSELERARDVSEQRTGPQGARYRSGDIVAGVMGGLGRFCNGSYSEYALLDPDCVSAPLPVGDAAQISTSTLISLAAIPATFLAAYGVLVTSLQIQPEDTLLVHGASSSIGMATASLAKHLYNVKKVVGTTRDAGKAARLKTAGFDEVLVRPHQDDSSIEEQAKSIKEAAEEMAGFTAQVDLIGADHIPVALACARSPGGARVCQAGMLAGAYFCTEPFSPMAIPVGVYLCGYSSSFADHLNPLRELVTAVLQKKLPTNVDKVFRIEDVPQAHEYYERSTRCGKVVCLID